MYRKMRKFRPRKFTKKSKKYTKKPSKTLVKTIKRVVASQAEQKYVAVSVDDQVQVGTQIVTPSSLYPVLPKLFQGVGPQQRIGEQIRTCRGYVDFTFSFMNNYTPSGNWAIRVFMLNSKSIKDGQYIPNLAAGTLLDQGDGLTTDWIPSADNVVQLSQMVLSRENWSGQYKTLYLSKNNGGMNADATPGALASANAVKFGTHATCRFTWKHAAPLKYETNNGALNNYFPTNYCPVYAYVAYPLDGYNITEISAAPIIVTTRQHMWYTDA